MTGSFGEGAMLRKGGQEDREPEASGACRRALYMRAPIGCAGRSAGKDTLDPLDARYIGRMSATNPKRKKPTTATRAKTREKPKPSMTGRKAKSRPTAASASAAAPGTSGAGNVHLYVGISLDGYIAAPDGGVDWLNPYGDARAGFGPFIRTISAYIMGRTTYDHAVARDGARALDDGGGTPFYVVTHRPLETASPHVIPFTGDLRVLVASMRQRHPGGDFWLMGGGGVTRSFLDADLIDILSVAFVPALLGAGLPMFPPSTFRERRLRLVRQHTYPSGVIELRYERAAAG
jgi:dihydrofolate reductase